jgi:hypothetical protein
VFSVFRTALAPAAAALMAAFVPLSANAAPAASPQQLRVAPDSMVTKAQVYFDFGVGRPDYYDDDVDYGPSYYRPYYGYRAAPAYPTYTDGPADAIARCEATFRSFDRATGTYTTYEGETRLCPYLR